eukprot:571292-Amphidinium_carterae.1
MLFTAARLLPMYDPELPLGVVVVVEVAHYTLAFQHQWLSQRLPPHLSEYHCQVRARLHVHQLIIRQNQSFHHVVFIGIGHEEGVAACLAALAVQDMLLPVHVRSGGVPELANFDQGRTLRLRRDDGHRCLKGPLWCNVPPSTALLFASTKGLAAKVFQCRRAHASLAKLGNFGEEMYQQEPEGQEIM